MARIATTDLYSARGTEMPSSPVSPVSPIFHRFYTDNALRKGADDEMLVDVDPRPATMPPLRRSPIADMEFCQRLPKVELHAHLTGSISRETLQRIWEERTAAEGELGIEPPSMALADPSGSQGIDVFFSHFNSYIYHLISTPAALQFATRAVLSEFLADGVRYLELRTTPRALSPRTGAPTSAEASLRLVVSELNAWNASEAGQRMPVRLIVAVDRAKHDRTAAEWIVDLALRLRDEGAPVVALDLCGDPNKVMNVATLRAPFLRARRAGLPCVLHFAEVPASSHTAELEELLSWHPRRLGHTIHVPPAMRERILALGAAPELCLSCNVLAQMLPPQPIAERTGSTTSRDRDGGDSSEEPHSPLPTYLPHAHGPCRPATFVDHHFGWWWAAGGPLSLGTDDVGVFGSPSSAEHYHAATHFGLSPRDLVELSRRATAGSLGGPADELRMDRLLDAFVRAEGIEVDEVARAFDGTEML